MQFSCTTPCGNCPFRTDSLPYSSAEAIQTIRSKIGYNGFICHKSLNRFTDKEETLVLNQRDGLGLSTTLNQDFHVACSGAMILLMKERGALHDVAIRNYFDPQSLDMDAPVFNSFDEMISHHDRPLDLYLCEKDKALVPVKLCPVEQKS